MYNNVGSTCAMVKTLYTYVYMYIYIYTHLYTVYNGNPSQIGNHSTYRYQHVGWDPSPDDPQIPHKRSEIGHS